MSRMIFFVGSVLGLMVLSPAHGSQGAHLERILLQKAKRTVERLNGSGRNAPASVQKEGPLPAPIRNAKIRVAIDKTWYEKSEGKFEERTERVCDRESTFRVFETGNSDVLHLSPEDVKRVVCVSSVDGFPVIVNVGGVVNQFVTDVFGDGRPVPLKGIFSFTNVNFHTSDPGFPENKPLPRLPESGFSIAARGDVGERTIDFLFPGQLQQISCTSEAKPVPSASVFLGEPVGFSRTAAPRVTTDDGGETGTESGPANGNCTSKYPATFSTIVEVEDAP